MFAVPRDAVLEVPLSHPGYPWLADLGLRWYAVPVISDMYLDAGGIRYPCAPFNGWYMGTRSGHGNLADTGRYNQLPEIAARMGLDTSTERTLWRDHALVALNLAVLHSFDEAGVTVTDHHTESDRFLSTSRVKNAPGGCARPTGHGSCRRCPGRQLPSSTATTPMLICGPASTGVRRPPVSRPS